MIDPQQLYDLVIVPTLTHIGLHSDAAAQLVLGTHLQEANVRGVTHLKQLGQGPALGIYQCEPSTHDDYWKTYLWHNVDLSRRILPNWDKNRVPTTIPPASRLIWDLRYATALCRVHYRRIPHPLPGAGDIVGQSEYWKRFYNTRLGKGKPEQFVRAALGSDMNRLWSQSA